MQSPQPQSRPSLLIALLQVSKFQPNHLPPHFCCRSRPCQYQPRFQASQFVEMRELLPDNFALAERMVTLPQQSLICSSGTGPLQIVQREVASINSWMCAFVTYMYVVIHSVSHPSLVTSHPAYMRNIIRKTSRFEGDGWRTYNYAFRSQVAADTSMDWATTNPLLMLAYMQCSDPVAKLPCPLCHETDHQSQSCTLASLVPPSTQPPAYRGTRADALHWADAATSTSVLPAGRRTSPGTRFSSAKLSGQQHSGPLLSASLMA